MTSNSQLVNQSSHSGEGWVVVGEENMTLPVCDLQEQLEKVSGTFSTLACSGYLFIFQSASGTGLAFILFTGEGWAFL